MEFYIKVHLVFAIFISIAKGQNVNCNGKTFICKDSANFIECVDVGAGLFITVDNTGNPCDPGTVCDVNNALPCQRPPPTTTLPPSPVNCNGKSFICASSTRFRECVDIGGGATVTVSDDTSECPQGTFCSNNNNEQCVVPATTTSKKPTTTTSSTSTSRKPTTTTSSTSTSRKPTTTTSSTSTSRKPTTTTSSTSTSRKPTTTTSSTSTSRKPTTTTSSTSTSRKPTTTTTSSSTSRKPTTTTSSKKPTTTKKTITTTKKVTADCPRSGKFGDPSDCHIYYICVGVMKVRYYCPFNSVFSSSIGGCTTNKDECVSASYTCVVNGNFQDPKNCYSHFNCKRSGKQFKVMRQSCGQGESFHKFLGVCKKGKMGCAGKIPM